MTFHGRLLNVWMQFQMNKFSKVNIFSHVSEKLLKFSKLNIFRHVYQQFLIFLDISQHLMTSAKYQQKMLKWLIRKGRDLTEARKDTFAKPAKPVSSQGPPCLLVLFCLHSYHTCWEYPPVHSENESRIFWYPLLPLQNNYSRNCL